MRALGTIVGSYAGMELTTSVHCGLLDYYDHWTEVDPRLAPHYDYLSRSASILGNDLVNMATYVHEILRYVPVGRTEGSHGVVTIGAMTEAFLVAVRSAYDAAAIALSYVVSEKRGQAPADSLRALVNWAKRNDTRARPRIREFLLLEHRGFWNLREIRDHIVHGGAQATIHCDGHQFNLWLHSPKGWITREPLLPLLAWHLDSLLMFADAAAIAVNEVIQLPPDRLGSRAVEGIFIEELHKLRRVAHDYGAPSP